MDDMHVFNGVRYRVEDAIRLGLVAKGAVLTARSENTRLERTHTAPEGLITTAAANLQQQQEEPDGEGQDPAAGEDPARPHNGQSKADWTRYALSVGVTAEQLEGLKRDQIIPLVDEHLAAAKGDE